ncbi:30S ribosomal protein S4 [Brevibacillus laterosporus]|uniref:Small ribosomal subunit protein uS4 n=1 Tax=Brevibacillus laterosporus TaxID=1465 RepID=A0AAP8Q9W5_BRELA|nr:30S ribosomal protein S4 [Brevibacillus laterosporus]ATO51975.1 30S ribosomal protein S4 [Brevibacillus laterosporus DSM 25]MBG9787581.1 30S ribosomal protein S4 [Brevibacillus laterosporus]MBG9796604.1 30S ribosomal protein S4 [Brevibacillus laterosporus]MBG9800924.1 30S ribosomal protein S4 [Brevibacillus laterosporus]MCG7319416.1 30S ribosomal protein S4 [Brevibacillus laterosporus]
MSRYTGPRHKLARRLGISLDGTGKDLKRNFAPGQHGQSRRKLTEYGIQLQEKQKLRHMFGVNEKQFRRTFEHAQKMRGVLGENFMKLLESRLDNVVFRMGFAATRPAARQLVNHGHMTVNGKKVDIASYRVQPGDVITLREKSRGLAIVKESLEARSFVPNYITFDDNKVEGTFTRLPDRSEMPAEINETLIVEWYSR